MIKDTLAPAPLVTLDPTHDAVVDHPSDIDAENVDEQPGNVEVEDMPPSVDPSVPTIPEGDGPRRSKRATAGLVPSRYQTDSAFMSQSSQVAPVSVSTPLDAPTTYREAIQGQWRENWTSAMKTEFDALVHNKTWELVKRPQGRRIVGSVWKYKVKFNPDGSINKFKARLCAQGFTQVAGLDFTDTFAPVARLSSLRIVIAVSSSQHGWVLEQSDIGNAYLHAELNEEIYMAQPEGFVTGNADNVLRLRKCLYGLKQSGREWNAHLMKWLTNYGFVSCLADPCLLRLIDPTSGDTCLLLALWVDDLSYGGRRDVVEAFKTALVKKFGKVAHDGQLTWILGIHVSYLPHCVTLDQSKYIDDIIRRYGMVGCNPCSTPATTDKLEYATLQSDKTTQPFQQLIGSLMYVSVCTRPDITYAVAALARHTSLPTDAHYQAAKRVVRYLAGTKELGISFSRNTNAKQQPIILSGAVDSDWGTDATRKSTSGFIFRLGGAISWSSKLQRCVALSSTESEYIALSACVQEAVHLRAVINELYTAITATATTIHIDNSGAQQLASNPVFHDRTKHIDIRHHFVRDVQARKEVRLQHIHTAKNPADVLTKPLPIEVFKVHRAFVLGYDGDAHQGGVLKE